ncbi:MAG: nucleotidyl transferase AbiEii/AbiGii toxin family protein [Planctomycetota bacterium]|nr:MAG: nucleotidyl transferase AbiEii/AbiGii toxin family protein [Planctomycetota bacterium]REJ92034.1 MAG: nucleotidyl transferase AbiEii/AbiGii toxin family protein [Planctomycetota bacterium]REK28570.1 MAG: nucleotidyl transferase AbiEii/AbiGii toxin family protein [Planctomycetota bacterium]REK39185.1 MAG: nucleotidyl transferase AbiEii/AbiGii toxin family protein [Planctomycetota bacterium]
MTKRRVKDVAASVRARLQTNAKETNRPFQEVLQYFAMERFLYRLSQSPHAEKLVLKGGLMLMAWRAPSSRPTKDIDFLAKMPNDVDSVVQVVREICDQEVEPDGLVFDASSLEGRIIKEDADYEGVRVSFRATLQNARIHMQIDMGFGDVVVPSVVSMEYPTILDHEPPRLNAYSRETTVAEKFEAMVKLGQLNSRIRDFFDIWLLARQFDFDGQTLADAVQRTFANRGTVINVEPVALTPEFASDTAKQTQWTGFCRKSRIDFAPESLQEVCDAIALFIKPVAVAVQAEQPFDNHWQAPGPWRSATQ